MEVQIISTYIVFLVVIQFCFARIHKLQIIEDERKYIALSTFGFYKGGILDVKLHNFHAKPFHETDLFGFSLDRTLSDAMNPYLDSHQDSCLLEDPARSDYSSGFIYFRLNITSKRLIVNCGHDLQGVRIYKNANSVAAVRLKRDMSHFSDPSFLNQHRRRRSSLAVRDEDNTGVNRPIRNSGNACQELHKLNLPIVEWQYGGQKYYNTNFVVNVGSESDEGLYNLYFHNCANYKDGPQVALTFTIEIEENNNGNYLSAGEMPLPALYFMMALLFLLSGCIWLFILRKSNHPVYKIHYLMAVLVYLKSLSLMLQGMNYHFIQTKGEHIAAWAILYYVAHLLKGAVLFVTIVLVGTGWTLIKNTLSEKDKKIFMIVIPLQVLANVAEIIIEESEEGVIEHRTWRNVFILADLLCCGAILFPVTWSIRHLQEVFHTDAKAAINLRKLKLFRHFYIMIVCYIYFTRIVVYLIKITVPFQYEWLDEMFREMATYVFFVLTGYKFRPASANPNFQLSVDEDDEEVDVVRTDKIGKGLEEKTVKNKAAEKETHQKQIMISTVKEDFQHHVQEHPDRKIEV